MKAQLSVGLSWGAAVGSTSWLQASSPPTPPAALPCAILTFVNTPYKRGFYCGDDSIRYPYRPDTITHGLMAGVIITATVILVRQEGVRGGSWGVGRSSPAWGGVCAEESPLGSPVPQ